MAQVVAVSEETVVPVALAREVAVQEVLVQVMASEPD